MQVTTLFSTSKSTEELRLNVNDSWLLLLLRNVSEKRDSTRRLGSTNDVLSARETVPCDNIGGKKARMLTVWQRDSLAVWAPRQVVGGFWSQPSANERRAWTITGTAKLRGLELGTSARLRYIYIFIYDSIRAAFMKGCDVSRSLRMSNDVWRETRQIATHGHCLLISRNDSEIILRKNRLTITQGIRE